MKNKKTIIFVVLLIIAVLVFVFKDKLFAANTKTPIGDQVDQSNNDQSKFMLKKGSKGDQVKLVQAYMTEFFKAGLIVDGIWGANTQAAFESFASKVDFIASGQGITTAEFEYLKPQSEYLSKKYFNIK